VELKRKAILDNKSKHKNTEHLNKEGRKPNQFLKIKFPREPKSGEVPPLIF
jgi:hypothetical protein